jgi:hypothetical protein
MPLVAPSKTAPLLVWAKWWVAQGWSVFPVCSPDMGPHKHNKSDETMCDESNRDYGKRPMVGNGFQVATTDIEQLELWWNRWPNANIAGVPPVDHFMVDIDGETDLKFPDTWEHGTGKGRHLLFKQNPNNPVPHGQKVWPNIDTRLNGKGYVCLPPSLHASGTKYTLTAQRPVCMFPTTIKPTKGVAKRRTKKDANPGDDVVSVLLKAPDDPTAGDDDMIKIAGYLARFIPDRDAFCAVMHRINGYLVDPLTDSAMDKKFSQWDRHREVTEIKEAKRLDDESRGWLFPREQGGYDTPIEGRDGTVTYMPITDFQITARGIVASPDYTKRMFIVDLIKSDGEVIGGIKVDTDVLMDKARTLRWLAKYGVSTYDNAGDKRKGMHVGQRLHKLLESQDPEQLLSRDHYGWCEESQAVLTTQGEISADGLRDFTYVYPDDKLSHDAPTAFSFDADLAQARDWLSRLLALQPEREAAKVGAWAMMLLLRGQWKGLMPGLLVQASAGTGKTRFFQLLFKMLGSTNDGEAYTDATLRDALAANLNGAVWLDDCHLTEKQEQDMRVALTGGKKALKTQGQAGWETTSKTFRASIVVSGEGVDWYRQKAYRDRFIEAEFTNEIRTSDADKLVTDDIGRASGVLLMAVLQHADMLRECESLREGVVTRDDQARTTLRIGARILDAVLGTGHKWTQIIDEWYRGIAPDGTDGHASEGVLNVFPRLWMRDKHPMSAGQGQLLKAIWYDQVEKVFWVNVVACADLWNQTQRNLSQREQQMTSASALTKELRTCGSPGSENKYAASMGGRKGKGAKYWKLPKMYSDMVLDHANYVPESDDDD